MKKYANKATLKNKRLSRKQAIFALVFGIAGTVILFKSFAASAATYYVSPAGSSSASTCISSQPCSLDHAYQLASPGDTIQLAQANYGNQTIHFDSSKTTGNIDMYANGSSFGDFSINSGYLTFHGPFTATDFSTNGSGSNKIHNVTVEDGVVDNQNRSGVTPAYAANLDTVTWRRMEVKNGRESNMLLLLDGGAPTAGSLTNFTLEDSSFHDSYIATNSTNHVQCIFVAGTQYTVFRRNHFYNCTTFDVFVADTTNGDKPMDHTYENNVFEKVFANGDPNSGQIPNCCQINPIKFRDDAPINGLNFRYNTDDGPLYLNSVDPVGPQGGSVTDNIITGGVNCKANITFKRNIVGDHSCDSTDKVVFVDDIPVGGGNGLDDSTGKTKDQAFGLVNSNASDFHLTSGSPAINYGSTASNSYPSTDKDNNARPSGAAPDSGAYEYGAVSSGQQANLWVDNDGGTCARTAGSGATYDTTTACGSLDQAYSKSQPGDQIYLMSNGSNYGAQHINAISGRGSTETKIGAASGQNVTIASLDINADNVTVSDLHITNGIDVDSNYMDNSANLNQFPYNDPVQNVTLKNNNMKRLDIRNTKDLHVIGGDIGGMIDTQVIHFDGQIVGVTGSPATTSNYNFVIDGTDIHDATRTGSGVHTECIAAWSVQGYTQRNTHMWNCAVYNVSMSKIGSDLNPTNYLLENNIFEAADDLVAGDKNGFYTMVYQTSTFGGQTVLRNNYMEQQPQIDPSATFSNPLKVYNNIMPKDFNCSDAIYSHNAMARSGSACSGNTLIPSISSQVVNANSNNFHLVSGAGAIGAGDPAFSPATDKDGNPRDSSPDAGPYEYLGSTSSSAPTNTTAPTTSGTTRVSSVLASTQGSWSNSPTSYSYQWQRCDSSGANCVNISGATSSSFTLTCSDYKKTLKVAVKATNSSGNATATSNATAAIAKPSSPKPGDFNDDCFIDAADISQFISGWRKAVATYPTLDITGPTNTPDSFIDAWDLQLLVTGYGYKG
jgi:hypothetical protein